VAGQLFVRRRDGRIEVRLNEAGRAFAKDAFAQVIAAESDAQHVWHSSLTSPIDPAQDSDDPLAVLARQNAANTNAELAFASADEEFLNDGEAWAWMVTLQLALRGVAMANGVLTNESWNNAHGDVRDYILSLQNFLFGLAEVL
jgi:hypothetical protein